MIEQVKKHKWQLLLASILILLPIAAGVWLWDRLPEQVATHWGTNGEPDGWSSRGFAVFGLPLLMLALNWICLLAEQKNFKQNPKPMWLVFWICPAIALIGSAVTYGYALGVAIKMRVLAGALLGVVFILMGNYLPKCKHNYTLGIKLPWTYASEANWNATHRLGGHVWVACGVGMLLTLLLPEKLAFGAMLALALAACVIPAVYSYLYSRRNG